MIKIIFIASILTIFANFTANACSAIQEKGQKNITVLMVNGIGNEYQDACSSLVKLKDTLSENGIDVDKITGFGFDLFHNPTDGSIGDINELRIQAALSSEAVKRDSSSTAVGYSSALGALYNNLVYAVLDKTIQNPCLSYIKYNTTSSSYLKFASKGAFAYDEDYCLRVASTAISLARRLSSLASQGNGVVVVAHSQGNFYLEAAYAILRVKNDPNLSKIRGVGVAAISLHPVSNRYLTISQDNALFLAQRLNTEMLNDLQYHPASFTHTTCIRTITSCSLNDGENASTIAAITGTASFSDTQVAYLGLDNNNIALMHEFVEVYLNKNLTDDSLNRITLPTRISNMVKDSIVELGGSFSTPLTVLSAFQTGTYDYSTDMQCYYKNILGSSIGTNEYAVSETKYCLNSTKNAWVQTVDDAGLLLLPNGSWVSGNSPNIVITGANSFTSNFGGYAFQSGSFTQNTVGSNYPSGSTSGTVSVTDTRDRYILWTTTSDSYVYNNTTSLNSLISTWNSSFNGQATLSRTNKYGWSFVTPPVTDYTAGIYKLYDISQQPTCTTNGTGANVVTTCGRPVLAQGAWTKNILSDGSPAIELNVYSPYTDLLIFGNTGERALYVKRASDSGVREGVRKLSGGTRSFNSVNRTYMNADLAARGYPTTVN